MARDWDWVWVATAVAEAAHLEQIAEHGGGEGVRDPGLLESARAHPQNLERFAINLQRILRL